MWGALGRIAGTAAKGVGRGAWGATKFTGKAGLGAAGILGSHFLDEAVGGRRRNHFGSVSPAASKNRNNKPISDDQLENIYIQTTILNQTLQDNNTLLNQIAGLLKDGNSSNKSSKSGNLLSDLLGLGGLGLGKSKIKPKAGPGFGSKIKNWFNKIPGKGKAAAILGGALGAVALANMGSKEEDELIKESKNKSQAAKKKYGKDLVAKARSKYQPWYKRSTIDADDSSDEEYVKKYLANPNEDIDPSPTTEERWKMVNPGKEFPRKKKTEYRELEGSLKTVSSNDTSTKKLKISVDELIFKADTIIFDIGQGKGSGFSSGGFQKASLTDTVAAPRAQGFGMPNPSSGISIPSIGSIPSEGIQGLISGSGAQIGSGRATSGGSSSASENNSTNNSSEDNSNKKLSTSSFTKTGPENHQFKFEKQSTNTTASNGDLDKSAYDKMFNGTPLAGHYDTVVKEAQKNNISPAMMAGIMAHETGRGTSNMLKQRNNPAGIMDPKTNWSKGKTFDTIEEGIAAAGRTIGKNYQRANGDMAKLASIYAPVGAANDPRNLNQHWQSGVSKYQNQLTAQTTNQNSRVASLDPSSEISPNGKNIKEVAVKKQDLGLTSSMFSNQLTKLEKPENKSILPVSVVYDQEKAYKNTGKVILRDPKTGNILGTYPFVSGGGGKGSTPTGEMNVAQGMMTGGPLGDRFRVFQPNVGPDSVKDNSINDTRSAIRFHAAHGNGTLGCIGIKGDSKIYQDFRNNMIYIQKNSGGAPVKMRVGTPEALAAMQNMDKPPTNEPPLSVAKTASASLPVDSSLLLSQPIKNQNVSNNENLTPKPIDSSPPKTAELKPPEPIKAEAPKPTITVKAGGKESSGPVESKAPMPPVEPENKKENPATSDDTKE